MDAQKKAQSLFASRYGSEASSSSSSSSSSKTALRDRAFNMATSKQEEEDAEKKADEEDVSIQAKERHANGAL